MAHWFNLLKYLDEKQVNFFFQIGKEETLDANSILIKKDSNIDSIYFIIKGLLHVYTSSTLVPDKILGPGEIVGEISFLDEGESTAAIVAKEDVLLLKFPKSLLKEKLVQDPAFAANFYKSLALIVANRLRITLEELTFAKDANEIVTELTSIHEFTELFIALQNFKKMMSEITKFAVVQNKKLPDNLLQQAQQQFFSLLQIANASIGAQSSNNIELKKKVGKQLQAEILPFILLTQCALRGYAKPRGYAGDYLMIDSIYQNKGSGVGVVGPLIDQCFLDLKVCSAVRNRRHVLVEEIMSLINSSDKPIKIASFACGPARELFDVYEKLSDKSRLKASLIDFDMHALAFVADKIAQFRLEKQIELFNENLIYLAIGRKKPSFGQQDLIYSIGLIDYFEDSLVIQLINFIYDYLVEGGKVILGNFHPDNPDRVLMEDVLEWYLIHRNEDDMNRLFLASKFKKPCDKIIFEKNHINLFAECTKK